MKKVHGVTRSVDELLRSKKFAIGYFQREYSWKEKHIRELIKDLSDKFFDEHKEDDERANVADYDHYYLGSIVVSEKNDKKIIIDGQQRLTSLTLILIHIYQQINDKEKGSLHDLITSRAYGKDSFNLDVEERTDCIDALFEGNEFEEKGQPESVINILERYRDIQKHFPKKLKGETLLYFADWLRGNVHLVEITANSDVDAYTIFVTMNDRGLPLNPTDKLKGYFLSKIKDDEQRNSVGKLWQDQMLALGRETDSIGRSDEAANFIKSWLISQYAEEFSENANVEVFRGLDTFSQYEHLYKTEENEDLMKINVDSYRWVSEHCKTRLDLKKSDSFVRFVRDDFAFYSKWYQFIRNASEKPTKNLEAIYRAYNPRLIMWDVSYVLFLAPLCREDKENEVLRKLRIVARYIDILISRYGWNLKAGNNVITYRGGMLQPVTPRMIKEIRRKSPEELAEVLMRHLATEKNPFGLNCRRRYGRNHNSTQIRRILARITDFVEVNAERGSHYEEYVERRTPIKSHFAEYMERRAPNWKYDIEHVLPEKPKKDEGEFKNRARRRNLIGGLLLIPMSPNRSFKDKSYTEKRSRYLKQNLLAQSLYEEGYDNDPGFRRFNEKLDKETGHKFKPYDKFDENAILERQELYRAIAKKIWDPETLRFELEN